MSRPGQIILRLDDTSPKANLEIFRNQLYAAVAREARLAAELDGSPDVQFPDELTDSFQRSYRRKSN